MANLEAILQEIRQETEGKTLEIPAFETVKLGAGAPRDNRTFDALSLQKNLDYVRVHNRVTPFMPLFGNPAAVFVKRVIRKLIKFQVGPTVEAQNDITENLSGVVLYLADRVDELTQKLDSLTRDTDKNEEENAK